MKEYRYPANTIRAIYARALCGLLLTAGPLISVITTEVVAFILSVLATVFLIYGVVGCVRGRTIVRMDDVGISRVGFSPVEIAWSDLSKVRLQYYSTRRDGRNGWLQLIVRGDGRSLSIESSIDGFVEVTKRVVSEAHKRGLDLPLATLANLEPLGLSRETGPQMSLAR